MSLNSVFRPASIACLLAIATLLTLSLFPVPAGPVFAQGQAQGHGFNGGSGSSPVVDPGPRGAPAGAGHPIANLTPDQLRFFNDGASRFVHSEGVANGLGPTFNADSCGACHSQPAIGGTSPSATAFPNVGANPQVALATANGGKNSIPFFVPPNGPVREARFKFLMNANGSVDTTQPDGSVHDLFTIQGRNDAPAGCVLGQQDFLAAANQHNLALRIPTPTFGGGLIEMIDDATILANMHANQAAKSALGIRGKPNRNGNDATIARFGWKAQNKSLIMFSHEGLQRRDRGNQSDVPAKARVLPQPAAPELHCQPTARGSNKLLARRKRQRWRTQ